MLSEFAYPPRVPDCCVRSIWSCHPVPTPPLDGLRFLGSLSGSHEGAGITTGAALSNTDDGAGPTANIDVPFVDGGVGSTLTNSDYTPTSLGERVPSGIPEECCLEEGGSTGRMGQAAKENGGRQKTKACGTSILKRAIQDRLEAPRRKRIHLSGSNFGAVERRTATDAGAECSTAGAGFTHSFYPSRQGIDTDDGEAGVEKTSTRSVTERIVEVGNGVMEDVEMTEVTDESGEHEAVVTWPSLVEGIPIEATKADGDFRASEGEDGDSLRPVNLTGMQMLGSVLEYASPEGSQRQWWEGMGSGALPCRENDSSKDSARVLPSEVPDGTGGLSLRGIGISDYLGSESGRDNEILNDMGEGSFERRNESRKNEEDVSKHVELSSEVEPRSRNGYPPEDVEVIEVDDSDDDPIEINAYDSDGSSTKGTKPVTRPSVPRNGFRLSSSQSTFATYSPDEESDSDDCQVVEEWKPNLNTRHQQRNQAESEGQDDDSDTEDDRSDESDSSDVEVAGGPQSDIQRVWEEAALRRRMGRAMKSAGSKVNGEREATADLDLAEGPKSEGLAESVATSAFRDSPESTAESSEARGGADGFVIPGDRHAGVNLAKVSESSLPQTLNESDNTNPPDTEAKGVGNPNPHETRCPSNELNGEDSHREEPLSTIDVRTPSPSEPRQNSVGPGEDVDKGDFIAGREKLKQTREFLQADELEWASRQQELHRQQIEAQKLRQRKRVEADRKLEMERKQKMRVQELRQSQMKAEKDMDEKEQLRGQVRERLEYLASKHTDLAGLLRRLGINVDGGINPSEQQVNAAFKRALVKFHPDRVVDGDARRMVEAEETFKLINRMKKTIDDYDPFR